MRLDRRVEIAIEPVRAIGLALHVATQCGGLGTRLVKLVLKAVNPTLDLGELVPERLGLRARIGDFAAERLGLGVHVGKFGAHRVGLRLRLGEVGQEDVGLRLHFGQRCRQPFAALAFTSQLLVRGLERGLRLGACLLRIGLDRRQPFLQRRCLGPRVVKLAR